MEGVEWKEGCVSRTTEERGRDRSAAHVRVCGEEKDWVSACVCMDGGVGKRSLSFFLLACWLAPPPRVPCRRGACPNRRID